MKFVVEPLPFLVCARSRRQRLLGQGKAAWQKLASPVDFLQGPTANCQFQVKHSSGSLILNNPSYKRMVSGNDRAWLRSRGQDPKQTNRFFFQRLLKTTPALPGSGFYSEIPIGG